tara:strand:+ start:15696 stop:16289 length:594 start_codon:yes stop_codon:yes gene_type:complete
VGARLSDEDRRKWDERYGQGAYEGRPSPSPWLVRWLPQAPPGKALDVACGLGRNARFMADSGYRVDAVDISQQAIDRGAELAANQGLQVSWLAWDLDTGLPEALDGYQVIALFRYVNAPLLETLAERLTPGGYLIVEEHLQTSEQVAGPRNPSFRLAQGELRRQLDGLRLIAAEESLLQDPDGQTVALTRAVAQKVG